MSTHTHDYHLRHHHRDDVVVVMVPFPAQGHLNQLLQLSTLITTTYNIPVHYIGSSIHLHQAKLRLNTWVNPTATATIHFHDFHLTITSPSDCTSTYIPPDDDDDDDKTTRFPAHLQTVFESSTSQLRHPITHLLRKLSTRYARVVVIHDSLMSSVVQEVTNLPNTESYSFHSVSAFALFFYVWEVMGKPDIIKLNDDDDDHFHCHSIPSNEGCFTKKFEDFMVEQYKFLNQSSGRIYNTSNVIEGKYIDFLQYLPINVNKKLFAIGPLNPVVNRSSGSHCRYKFRHKCIEWLNKQEVDSVLYISFGTTTSMTNNELHAIAIGLEQSRQKFIWVLTSPDGRTLNNDNDTKLLQQQLPNGFEERVTVAGKGMVIRDWAPQLEVLGHVSTGGFMTHCGWNSCMESISMGVPIAAWPMHSDQPKNAVLLTEVLRVGLVVRDWGRRKVVTAFGVETAVRRLMVSEEGSVMRKRAKELGYKVRDAGLSRLEMDSFVAHITRR